MPIAKITGQGLTAIALAVALLWTCVLTERSLQQRASLERSRLLREVNLMQRRESPRPVSLPLHHVAPPRPLAG